LAKGDLMTVFQFDDYKACFLKWLEEMPNSGRGQFRRLAQHLRVSSVFITQVFRGDRDLNPDQALDTTEFMGLTELETEYFLLLVQEARAGGHRLKTRVRKKRQALKVEAIDLKKQISQDAELSHEAKSVFYGHWHYSAVRLLCSLPGFETSAEIATKFQLPIDRVNQILGFLNQHQLIVPTKRGWKMGPKVTHLEASSPFIISRQIQWRTKGFEAMSTSSPENLFYTGPMSLDEKTFEEVRQILADAIRNVVDKVKPSEPAMLACLNLDWFRL
jgi:uncharacterized protein (TIGR02147 family)